MASIRFLGWLAVGVIAAGVAAAPAHALTFMKGPTNSDGSNFADPDDQIQNNFSGNQSQGNQNSRGFHFQVIGPDSSQGSSAGTRRPLNGTMDPNSPYAEPTGPSGMFWPPGMRR